MTRDLKRRRDFCAPNDRMWIMQQQISLITLGVKDLRTAKRFYCDGFGWAPIFDNKEIVFFQMNGLVLGLWLAEELEKDSQRDKARGPGAFALAHNVATRAEVEPLMARLTQFGGRVLKPAVEPPHGGYAGYVADPDDHAWDIAWNPAWTIACDGRVAFAT
jgi:catechol 2,3-dioxygenase-like lactoylglutathione lyase family enzyme